MEDRYTFRRCEKSDMPGMSNLVAQVLGTKRNRAYWEWKYFKNPAGHALTALSLNRERVVGQIGAIPVRFSVRGKEVAGAQELDVAMFEDHRRFDLFLKMVILGKEILLKENVGFSYGLTNEFTSEIVHALMPKKKVSPIPRLVKLLDVKPILRQRLPVDVFSGIISSPVNIVLAMRYPRKIVIPEGMKVSRIHRFDERFDAFWNRVKKDYPIMLVKDSSYLNWRYVEAAHMDYEIFCLEQTGSNEIAGFVVLGETVMDSLVGQIFDIVTPRDEDGTINSCLLRFAVSRFRKKKATMIRCWMFAHTHVYRELMRIGFVPRENRDRVLLFQNTNVKKSGAFQDLAGDSKSWYLTKGDSDID